MKRYKVPENFGSYSREDVIFLLKNLNGLIDEKSNEEREAVVQNGGHYSEMLPVEYFPTEEYIRLFHTILQDTKVKVAEAVAVVAEIIKEKRSSNLVLVSLARAGTPIGILIKRYIQAKYAITLPHYSISIIRGKGIDKNALRFILQTHPDADIQFIDGWTGKGSIKTTLEAALKDFYHSDAIELDPTLAVVADPGECVPICGTKEDFLIPSACLNATVSGLISRTVLRDDLIGEDDFHGAKFYKEWQQDDLSNMFIDTITECFGKTDVDTTDLEQYVNCMSDKGIKEMKLIQERFGISDINRIKPGVGETTRVLLRRMPWKILVNSLDNPNLKHIVLLAKDRNVPIEIYKDMGYGCCGLIKSVKEI